MLYLTTSDLRQIGVNWEDIFSTLEGAVQLRLTNQYSQPIKPYLRYGNVENRIIAMPAYVGAQFDVAGIKWISSFPGNVRKNIPRAHSVVVLNDSATGKPLAVFNSSLLSEIRTAGISGLVIRKYLNSIEQRQSVNFGVVGVGPIGMMHCYMIGSCFLRHPGNIFLYDLKSIPMNYLDSTTTKACVKCNSWQEVFYNADVFVTCTVSEKRYVNLMPKTRTLYLNVSLRDFQPSFFQKVDLIVVDDWGEVCRENTDIEVVSVDGKIDRTRVLNIEEFMFGDISSRVNGDKVVMFNPMGLAVFDISLAKYYYDQALSKNIGITLPDK